MRVLVDHNIEGQAVLIQGTINSEGWTELIPIDWVMFSQAGLPEDSDDRVVWRFAQQGAMILLTANRRMIGEDSLEQVIREENEPDSLPVLTISDAKRVIEPEYRERCAVRLLEIADNLVNFLGTGRLFIP